MIIIPIGPGVNNWMDTDTNLIAKTIKAYKQCIFWKFNIIVAVY